MTSPSSKPRLFRLQFSLRALLVLTTVVAVGLTVFRWPWTVERSDEDGLVGRKHVTSTTWRRGWNGKPEKHGIERGMQIGLHTGYERQYVNGELISVRTFINGVPSDKMTFRNGFVVIAPKTSALPPEIRGVWTSTKQYGDEIVTQRCAWRNAERHGLSTWTSSNGKVLQSAEFDRGRIVKWNGEPAAAALERWIKERVENQDFHKPLLTELANKEAYFHWGQSRRGILWASNEGIFLVHYGFKTVQFAEPTDWLSCYQGRRLGEVILEMALNDSGMLDHRYGAPCIVPICTSELNWRDPTGIAAVKFEPESQAAKDWIGPGHVDFMLTGWPATQLKNLCNDKAIKIDTTAVDHLEPPPYTGPDVNAIPDYPRPLRDVFGHILYDAGYRCEQQGDTIVVLPMRSPNSAAK